MIRFSQIPEKLKYPPSFKGTLSTYHSAVVEYATKTFKMTHKYRSAILNGMNVLSYLVVSGDAIPKDWAESSPITGLPEIDQDVMKGLLGSIYLEDKNINWDIQEVDYESAPAIVTKPIAKSLMPTIIKPAGKTEKSDLYLKPPTVPQFDVNSLWYSTVIDGQVCPIYKTLPIIPTKQNEISVTTEVSILSDEDLLKLYPTQLVQTRAAGCYSECPGLDYDDDLGVILPISGFTKKQIIDNMIQYPHFYKLFKVGPEGQIVNFFATIEIDGELRDTLAVWNDLPESKKIPRNSDLIKEYVIRRYLLERDVKHVQHKYPLYGSLDPFLTLFMPAEMYAVRGYSDSLDLAKRCVSSRVSYKRSRNPILNAEGGHIDA